MLSHVHRLLCTTSRVTFCFHDAQYSSVEVVWNLNSSTGQFVSCRLSITSDLLNIINQWDCHNWGYWRKQVKVNLGFTEKTNPIFFSGSRKGRLFPSQENLKANEPNRQSKWWLTVLITGFRGRSANSFKKSRVSVSRCLEFLITCGSPMAQQSPTVFPMLSLIQRLTAWMQPRTWISSCRVSRWYTDQTKTTTRQFHFQSQTELPLKINRSREFRQSTKL